VRQKLPTENLNKRKVKRLDEFEKDDTRSEEARYALVDKRRYDMESHMRKN